MAGARSSLLVCIVLEILFVFEVEGQGEFATSGAFDLYVTHVHYVRGTLHVHIMRLQYKCRVL